MSGICPGCGSQLCEAQAYSPTPPEPRYLDVRQADPNPSESAQPSPSHIAYADLSEYPIPNCNVSDEMSADGLLQEWKEQMPEVPTAAEVSSAFKPSGRAPASAYLAMSIAMPVAVVGSAIATILGSFLFSIGMRILIYLPDRILKIAHIVQNGGTWDKTIEIIGTCAASVMTGMVGGGAAGYIVAGAGNLGKNRSEGVAAAYSVVSFLIMIALLVVAFINGYGNFNLQSAIGSQWLLIICLLIVAVLGSGFAMERGASIVSANPFCEQCGVFMVMKNMPSLSYRAARHAIRAIKDGDISEFVRRLKSEPGHDGIPRVYVCQKCGNGFAELTILFKGEWSEKDIMERQVQKSLSPAWLAASVPINETESRILPM